MPDELAVLFVTSGWPTAEQPEQSIFVSRQADALRALGVVVDVVSYVGANNPRNYLRARREIKAHLARRRYDLIHAHFGQSFLALPRWRPTVMTFYGSDLIGVVGDSGGYTTRGRVLSAVSRWASRRVDGVVVLSRTLGAKLPDGIPFTVIPLGVDIETFRPRPKDEARRMLGLSGDRPLVLFGGRPSQPVKRLPLAEAAVGALGGEAELVVLEGKTHAEVAMYMNACDVLLVTSRHESGPLVVKEALASDLPVVSVDVGDVREWIAAVEGCIVTADDGVATISAALAKVLADGRPVEGRRVAESLAEDVLVHRVMDVYATVAARPVG